MKKTVIAAAFVLAAFASTSCRETKTETREVIREVEVERVETSDDEGILERAAKEVDNEINEEINEEIDKIGNDD